MGIGFQELLLIFLIVLLLFGAKRLPEIARSLGKASNEFKKAKDEITNNYDDSSSQRPAAPAPQQQPAPQQPPAPPQPPQQQNA